jgi:two-component system sensor histidine kinase YesM
VSTECTHSNLFSIYEKKDGRIGLINVNDRIKLYFGNEYGVSLTSIVNKGTKVTLTFPVSD